MTTVSKDYGRRGVLAGALAAGLCPAATLAAERFDAVVGPGGFATVKAAIDAAPAKPAAPFRILVKPGVWREKIVIDKPFIHLIGESRAQTELTFDAAAGQPSPDGTAWGTFRSASLIINAPDCALSNLRVANSFDYLQARRAPSSTNAGNGLQAVALALMQNADRTLIEHVDIAGYQDTLLTNAGRSLFRNSSITGAVDFIFGAGAAFFDRCRIVVRGRLDMNGQRQGYITAPSTLTANPYGLIFDRCRLEKEPPLKRGVIALGRPWRPSGNPLVTGQAVFLRCWMDDHVDGWDRMSFRDKDGATVWFEPGDARFFEYLSTGPGAAVTPGRRQLTSAQAAAFTPDKVLNNWKV